MSRFFTILLLIFVSAASFAQEPGEEVTKEEKKSSEKSVPKPDAKSKIRETESKTKKADGDGSEYHRARTQEEIEEKTSKGKADGKTKPQDKNNVDGVLNDR